MAIDLWSYRDPRLADVDVVGYEVEARDGPLGTIDEASFEAGAGYVVVDTSTWRNLGMGRQSLIPAAAIERVDHGERRTYLSLTKEQIGDAPEYVRYDPGYRERVTTYYSPHVMEPGVQPVEPVRRR